MWEHSVMYKLVRSLSCTPETVTLRVNSTQILIVIIMIKQQKKEGREEATPSFMSTTLF